MTDRLTDQQLAADQWNARYPIGTPVFAFPGARPEDDPNDERLVTRTRTEASVLGGHTAVVWVDGHSACIALTHVDPVAAEDACGKCRTPFDPADTRYDGHARNGVTPYCRGCVDRCVDNDIADHRCVICA